MKTTSLMLAGLLSMIGTAAFAQTPVQQVHQDNAQIRQDTKEIHQDTHQIKKDNAVIAARKADVAVTKQELKTDRHERNALASAEQADVKKGDLAGAQQLDKARRAERHEINADKREIKHDDHVIAHRSADKKKEVVARRDEKTERHAEVVKRDHDAGKI